MTKLLSINADAKTVKGVKLGYLTGVMYLAPGKESGVMNACPFASAGCLNVCLYGSGRAALPKKDGTYPVKEARIRRTKMLKFEKELFFNQLIKEITALVKKAAKNELEPCVRLNGTSDIVWEKMKVRDNKNIFELFPDVQFYDYCKDPRRAISYGRGELPKNYHLTFSRSETNESDCLEVLKNGGNVAVVFSDKNLPEIWNGYTVMSGDETDLRFLDEPNTICGLYVKKNKNTKTDTSGFIVLTAGGAL